MGKPSSHSHLDFFHPPLETIIALDHPLARLARELDRSFIERRFGSSYGMTGPGHPALPPRLVAGLLILKHLHGLSDEAPARAP